MSDAGRHQPLLSTLRNQRDFDGDQKFCSADSGEETMSGLGLISGQSLSRHFS